MIFATREDVQKDRKKATKSPKVCWIGIRGVHMNSSFMHVHRDLEIVIDVYVYIYMYVCVCVLNPNSSEPTLLPDLVF